MHPGLTVSTWRMGGEHASRVNCEHLENGRWACIQGWWHCGHVAEGAGGGSAAGPPVEQQEVTTGGGEDNTDNTSKETISQPLAQRSLLLTLSLGTFSLSLSLSVSLSLSLFLLSPFHPPPFCLCLAVTVSACLSLPLCLFFPLPLLSQSLILSQSLSVCLSVSLCVSPPSRLSLPVFSLNFVYPLKNHKVTAIIIRMTRLKIGLIGKFLLSQVWVWYNWCRYIGMIMSISWREVIGLFPASTKC